MQNPWTIIKNSALALYEHLPPVELKTKIRIKAGLSAFAQTAAIWYTAVDEDDPPYIKLLLYASTFCFGISVYEKSKRWIALASFTKEEVALNKSFIEQTEWVRQGMGSAGSIARSLSGARSMYKILLKTDLKKAAGWLPHALFVINAIVLIATLAASGKKVKPLAEYPSNYERYVDRARAIMAYFLTACFTTSVGFGFFKLLLDSLKIISDGYFAETSFGDDPISSILYIFEAAIAIASAGPVFTAYGSLTANMFKHPLSEQEEDTFERINSTFRPVNLIFGSTTGGVAGTAIFQGLFNIGFWPSLVFGFSSGFSGLYCYIKALLWGEILEDTPKLQGVKIYPAEEIPADQTQESSPASANHLFP